MEVVKNIILFILAVVMAHYTAVYFGFFYSDLFSSSIPAGAGWIGTKVSGAYFDGILSSYAFFITLLLTTFGYGEKHKYIWIAIFLFPALLFLSQLQTPYTLFVVLVAVIGWGIGSLLNKFIRNLKEDIKNP